jgi:hypothetical protein
MLRLPSERSSLNIDTLDTYINQVIRTTIEQSMNDVSSVDETPIERWATRMTNHVLTDVYTCLADGEQQSHRQQSSSTNDDEFSKRDMKRRTTTNEQRACTFHSLRHRSLSALHTSTHTNQTCRDTIDSIVNAVTQQIYGDSFNDLRR